MHSNLADEEGRVTRRLVDFLERRAVGGCGTIVLESSSVDGQRGGTPGCLRIDEEGCEAGLAELVERIKEHSTRIIAQLWHAGPRAHCACDQRISASVHPDAEPSVRALREEEVPAIADQFVGAAVRANLVGFDAVEIHAAHGYLLHQFLSTKSNFREDRYGGNLVGRFEILREIREGISRVCPKLPVVLRASVERDDDVTGLGDLIESTGFQAVDVREGFTSYPPLRPDGRPPRCHTFDLAARIRPRCGLPIMLGGGILDAKSAELALTTVDADAIVVGRALLADPEWAHHVLENRPIAVCKYDCEPSCYGEVKSGRRIRCVYHEDSSGTAE
jgi:2,4-dienoyl-CoA reductase-like NADH-dependent reductase (Old Yellow Enzyme family)